MSDSTREQCRSHALSTKNLLEEIWDAIDSGDQFEGTDAYSYLDELPLEIVWETGEEFAVVLGTGGPHVEITGGGRNGAYKLAVYWAGESSYESGEAITRTGEYFRGLVSE